MKGIFENRPPIPKYSDTWDVGQVLRYLSSLSSNESLSLADLTRKTLVLCLLVSGKRRNAIVQLSLEGLRKSDSSYVFNAVKEKHHRPGKPRENIIFKSYDQDTSVCVIRCLKRYIEVTASLRGEDKQLFISYQKPFHAVKSATLGNWIRHVMSQAGIDIFRYAPHSARAASGSAAIQAHVPIDVLLEAVGWSNEATFATYYNKTIVQQPRERLASSVLSRAR